MKAKRAKKAKKGQEMHWYTCAVLILLSRDFHDVDDSEVFVLPPYVKTEDEALQRVAMIKDAEDRENGEFEEDESPFSWSPESLRENYTVAFRPRMIIE